MSATRQRPLVLRTSEGAWYLHLPTDQCNIPAPALADAITAALSTGS